MRDKPPFIASQRVLLLAPNVAGPHEFLRPEKFRAARLQAGVAEGDADQLESWATGIWTPLGQPQQPTQQEHRRQVSQ